MEPEPCAFSARDLPPRGGRAVLSARCVSAGRRRRLSSSTWLRLPGCPVQCQVGGSTERILSEPCLRECRRSRGSFLPARRPVLLLCWLGRTILICDFTTCTDTSSVRRLLLLFEGPLSSVPSERMFARPLRCHVQEGLPDHAASPGATVPADLSWRAA